MIQYQLDLTDGGLEVSKGLFFRYRKHGRAAAFAEHGICTEQMEWITEAYIPEVGNFVI